MNVVEPDTFKEPVIFWPPITFKSIASDEEIVKEPVIF